MKRKQEQALFDALKSCDDGLFALQQVELLKRLRHESNNHRTLVKSHSFC